MDFLTYMSNTINRFPNKTIQDLLEESGGVENLYIVYVDILKGFCEQGPLSSDRVNRMVQPVVSLTNGLLEQGLPSENIIFLNDRHPKNAVEFSSFAPHCIDGTEEADVVDALQPIQQRKGVQTFYKNATTGMFGTNQDGLKFFERLDQIFSEGKSTFLIVGDCTDLCIYQNAVGIRLYANEKNVETDVVVPISHIQTFDIPVQQAKQLDIDAHDADFLDTVFIYHMHLNGVRIIQTVE